MEKKYLKKQSQKHSMDDDKWKAAFEKGKCPEGCDLTKMTCPHIDAYITHNPRTSVNSASYPDIDRAVESRYKDVIKNKYDILNNIDISHTDFVGRLEQHALDSHEVLVLTEVFYFGHTYTQIAAEFGFVDPTTVYRIKKRALEKLKERDFTI